MVVVAIRCMMRLTVLIACQTIILFARQIFGGCNEKGRWDGAFPVKSSPIIVKEKER